MTNEQRSSIDRMRSDGLGYKKIAASIGISENTVKSYIRKTEKELSAPSRVIQTAANTCLCCGNLVSQNPGRKEKKFCSDKCRIDWWNRNRQLLNKKAVYKFVCPVCGMRFEAYGNPNRKYCSRDCYFSRKAGGSDAND